MIGVASVMNTKQLYNGVQLEWCTLYYEHNINMIFLQYYQ